uniref:Uncharacterized protein n=1 Tax=Rangifer tarandus platyrhynchus TaxID=3082113 RepID=A0ACB0FBX4_RANTA|nr:unnamed protein product [Rangifer tarandus platyrhynchus]
MGHAPRALREKGDVIRMTSVIYQSWEQHCVTGGACPLGPNRLWKKEPKGGYHERGFLGGEQAHLSGVPMVADFSIAHGFAGACNGGKRPVPERSPPAASAARPGAATPPARNKAPGRSPPLPARPDLSPRTLAQLGSGLRPPPPCPRQPEDSAAPSRPRGGRTDGFGPAACRPLRPVPAPAPP